MHDNKIDGLQLLVEENQISKAKAIETAERLYLLKKHFCRDELPTLINSIKSLDNIPVELEKIIKEAEEKVCSKNDTALQDKALLSIISKEKLEVVSSTFGHSLLQNIVLSETLPKEYDIFTAGIAATASSPIVGGLIAGVNVFRAMSQKKKFKEQLQKKEKSTQSSTEIFQSAINKMEFLLESTEEQAHEISEGITILAEGPKNYEMMSQKQQEELMQLTARMNVLSQNLTQKIEV